MAKQFAGVFCSEEPRAGRIQVDKPFVNRDADTIGRGFNCGTEPFFTFAQRLVDAVLGDADGGGVRGHVNQLEMALVR